MKILLVGGGSGGPVSPLIAVAEEIKKYHRGAKFLLVGTKNGPEAEMAEKARVPFKFIAAGKLRRYFSWKNFFSPIFIFLGFIQSFKILNAFKPDCVFGTGSFVQVPMIWAAWLKGIPAVLHQQDVAPGLANKLCQFAAKKITVTFPGSLSGFSSTLGIFYKKKQNEKIILTGNPFREELRDGLKARALKEFNLKSDLPVLLVLGGGTGAKFLNALIAECAPRLSKSLQIIHSTGKNKSKPILAENYHGYEFISNMADAYAASDIVVARAGLSTLTELANLKKLSIIIPMPQTHQELNALLMMEMQAAIVLNQNKIKAENFTNLIRKLLFAGEAQEILKTNISKIMPREGSKKIADIILKLANG